MLSSVHEMGFIRDFVTAVDSVLNLLSLCCSSSQLLFPGPSSSRTYCRSTSTATLWRPTSSCATSALLVRQWNNTAPLTLPQSARPVLRSILLSPGTGGIRANTAPRYVWGLVIHDLNLKRLQRTFKWLWNSLMTLYDPQKQTRPPEWRFLFSYYSYS